MSQVELSPFLFNDIEEYDNQPLEEYDSETSVNIEEIETERVNIDDYDIVYSEEEIEEMDIYEYELECKIISSTYLNNVKNQPLDFNDERPLYIHVSNSSIDWDYDRYLRKKRRVINDTKRERIIDAYVNSDLITYQLTSRLQQITNERNDWMPIVYMYALPKQDIINSLMHTDNDYLYTLVYQIRSREKSTMINELEAEVSDFIVEIEE